MKNLETSNGRARVTEAIKKQEEKTSVLDSPLRIAEIRLQIIGKTPLIQHAWSAKAIRIMLENQMNPDKDKLDKRKKREAKVPFDDFVGSLHIIDERKLPKKKLSKGESWPYIPNAFGIPVAAFAKGVRQILTGLGFRGVDRNTIDVVGSHGNLSALKYSRLVMREDMVMVGPFNKRSPDIRYRGMFEDWSTEVAFSFDEDMLSASQLLNALNRAGMFVGALEWRPGARQNPGTFGKYFVRQPK